jgi:DNA repair protein RadC
MNAATTGRGAGLALAGHLQQERLRVALAAAVAQDRPDSATLVAAQVARWDADDLLRRLRQAGEVGADGCWVTEARIAYQALLAGATAPVAPAAHARRPTFVPGELPPREKAERDGIAALSDRELLALLLRTGSANEGVLDLAGRLLENHDGLLGLAERDVQHLQELHGLGPAKATEIAAAFEVARRLSSASRRERVVLSSPAEVHQLLAPLLAPRSTECFVLLPLDPRCRLIGEPVEISSGDLDGTDAGPRAFYRAALQRCAARAIAAHNHPTGDPAPSPADRAVTARLINAGRIVGIELDDHVVIGDGGRYASLRGLAPELWRSSR